MSFCNVNFAIQKDSHIIEIWTDTCNVKHIYKLIKNPTEEFHWDTAKTMYEEKTLDKMRLSYIRNFSIIYHEKAMKFNPY